MNNEFIMYHYFRQDDNHQRQEDEILNLLRENWEIVSSVSNGDCIVYILKR